MLGQVRNLICLLLLMALSGCAMLRPALPAYGVSGKPQVFEGMGSHIRAVTTDSPKALEYVNQGINWMYSFNHDEAVRSFTKAAELDPECAMAWWGVAYAQGPNYNDPFMPETRSLAAWEALQKALARIENASPVERALIEALKHRYRNPAPKDRKLSPFHDHIAFN